MSLALPPYLVYTDTDGQPLENGYLYFGVANQNPQTTPVAIFWDVDLTIPAANPVRTLNGYASNNGSPGNIFTSGDFSITVRRSDETFVYSRLSNQESAASTAGLSYWLTNVIGTDAITADAAVSLPAYQDGLVVRLQSAGANTGAVTINVSGVGVVDVTKNGLAPLVAGDIPSGAAVELTYTGAGFQLTSITPNEYPTQARDSNNLKIANTAYADRAGRDKIPQVTASVAASALTITLDPCQIDFRNATGSSGIVSTRVVSAPISITVSSGSTLGTLDGRLSRVAVLAIDNAGTVELAVCNWYGDISLDESGFITTVAEGGVGGADLSTAYYSVTARTNVAYRVLGIVESTQATAGTWVTTPSFVQGASTAIVASKKYTGLRPKQNLVGIAEYTYTWIPEKATEIVIDIISAAVQTVAPIGVYVRIGAGSLATTGYSNYTQDIATTDKMLVIYRGSNGTYPVSARVVLSLCDDQTGEWLLGGVSAETTTPSSATVLASKTLNAVLDRVSVGIFGGTGTFVSGSVSIKVR